MFSNFKDKEKIADIVGISWTSLCFLTLNYFWRSMWTSSSQTLGRDPPINCEQNFSKSRESFKNWINGMLGLKINLMKLTFELSVSSSFAIFFMHFKMHVKLYGFRKFLLWKVGRGLKNLKNTDLNYLVKSNLRLRKVLFSTLIFFDPLLIFLQLRFGKKNYFCLFFEETFKIKVFLWILTEEKLFA